MKFFIIKLFATLLILTQLPAVAMLMENESENELRPIRGIPIVEMDIKTFKQCITLYNHKECLLSVVDKVIATLIEECSIFSAQDKCVSEYGSDEFVEAITSTIETKIKSPPDQDKLALKFQIITPNPKLQPNNNNSLRPIVLKRAPTILAAAPTLGPDGPDRDLNDDGPGDPYDPSIRIIITDPEPWAFLDEGPSGDDY